MIIIDNFLNEPDQIRESFGDNITNGRLVYTIFLKIDNSNK